MTDFKVSINFAFSVFLCRDSDLDFLRRLFFLLPDLERFRRSRFLDFSRSVRDLSRLFDRLFLRSRDLARSLPRDSLLGDGLLFVNEFLLLASGSSSESGFSSLTWASSSCVFFFLGFSLDFFP